MQNVNVTFNTIATLLGQIMVEKVGIAFAPPLVVSVVYFSDAFSATNMQFHQF